MKHSKYQTFSTKLNAWYWTHILPWRSLRTKFTRVHDALLNAISSHPQTRHRLSAPVIMTLGTWTWVSLHRECNLSVPFTAALSRAQHTLNNFLNIACTEFYPKCAPKIQKTVKKSFCPDVLSGHTVAQHSVPVYSQDTVAHHSVPVCSQGTQWHTILSRCALRTHSGTPFCPGVLSGHTVAQHSVPVCSQDTQWHTSLSCWSQLHGAFCTECRLTRSIHAENKSGN
jgi:hypothetical protein